MALAAEAQGLEKCLVARVIGALKVIKKLTTTCDEAQKTTAGREVLLVCLHMIGQQENPLGQFGNLYIRATGVLIVEPEFIEIDRRFAHIVVFV